MINSRLVQSVLGGLLVLTLGLNWYVRQPSLVPNIEFAPDMYRTPRFNTYEPNSNFTDGMTLRLPVVGTIARGNKPFPYGPGFRDSSRAGKELVNPFSSSDASTLERGAVVYNRYCALCHGVDGTGGGPVVDHGFPSPPSLLRPFTRRMPDGQIIHIITHGRSRMPSHAAQIPLDDRWKIVTHVRELQNNDMASPETGE